MVMWSLATAAAAVAAALALAAAPCRAYAEDRAGWVVLDDEGAYAAPAASRSDPSSPPYPTPDPPTAMPAAWRAAGLPARVTLTDFVDLTNATDAAAHGLNDTASSGVTPAASRVLQLDGEPYRVTNATDGFDVRTFTVLMACDTTPGTPNLLVVRVPDDRQRFPVITVTVPNGAPWAPPYTGEENHTYDPMRLSQEPDWYHPDVSVCSYNDAHGSPCSHRARNVFIVFYPKAEHVLVTIGTSGWDVDGDRSDPTRGAAASRVWVFKSASQALPVAARVASVTPGPATTTVAPAASAATPTSTALWTRPERDSALRRHMSVFVPHPWYFFAHFGVPPRTSAQRRVSLAAALNVLQFSGIDDVHFNVVNGADRTSRTWYNATQYPLGFQPFEFSLVQELGPLAAEANMTLLPVITSLAIPATNATVAAAYNITDDSFQYPADWNDWVRAFGDRVPDPLRPEVQRFMTDLVVEAAHACAGAAAVRGIGVRVNGKIGLGYIAWQASLPNGTTILQPAELAGFSAWNLAQFEAASGLTVPNAAPLQAYNWLRGDAARWAAWLDYRCRKTMHLWASLAAAVRQIRADWKLYVVTDLPAEVPATNVQWPGPDDPAATSESVELLRAQGFDPTLLTSSQAKDFVVERSMMTDADVFWAKWGPPWGSNPSRYREFHYQRDLLPLYDNTAGGGDGEVVTSIYSNYWEVPYWPQGEFGITADGSGLRTATASEGLRGVFASLCFALRFGNVTTLSLMAWDRATMAHEHDIRRFALAYRALPVGPSTVPPSLALAPGLAVDVTATAVPALGDDLWVASFGPAHLAVVNDGTTARANVTVTLSAPLPAGVTVVDSASGSVVAGGGGTAWTLPLLAFDLRTFVVVATAHV